MIGSVICIDAPKLPITLLLTILIYWQLLMKDYSFQEVSQLLRNSFALIIISKCSNSANENLMPIISLLEYSKNRIIIADVPVFHNINR
jgi:hypothetical protein